MDLDWIKPGQWVNAAGTGGFNPGKNLLQQFHELSMFITNPISYLPRLPADYCALIDYSGGFLVHTGWPNPGFYKVIQKYTSVWENAVCPICPHILGEDPDHIQKMVTTFENIENIYAVEIGIDLDTSCERIHTQIQAALGELPVILSLPIERIYEDWVSELFQSGISAISLQPLHGRIYRNEKWIKGRLYGGGQLPITFQAVNKLKQSGLPVFAGVGIVQRETVQQLFEMGAYGFQIHELAWMLE
ncbi:MAG: hypothetical protein CVU39_20410 [Chloroflexi bacterium HGW-Chloroflexi-10]|nr:MAG: hypothetical protein CVU39_20410 [Chloroflexi bacterium HGW-Chloroflexi-10]